MQTVLGLVALAGCAPAPQKRGNMATGHTQPDEPEATADVVSFVGFSFVDEVLAGMPKPGEGAPLADHLGFLVGQGVTLLVSATVVPTDPAAVAGAGVDALHPPVADFHAPTCVSAVAHGVRPFLRVRAPFPSWAAAGAAPEARGARQGNADWRALHGRTGTLLATWFVAEGYEPAEAIDEIRRLRPGSVETIAQEEAVFAFAHLWPEA